MLTTEISLACQHKGKDNSVFHTLPNTIFTV